MQKKDIAIVAVLLVLLLAWPAIYSRYFAPPPAPKPPQAAAEEPAEGAENAGGIERKSELRAAAEEEEAAPATRQAAAEPALPESCVAISNATLLLTFSSKGAGLKTAVLKEYPSTPRRDSPAVVLDFSDEPALTYAGIADFAAERDFEVSVSADGSRAWMRRRSASGLEWSRQIEFESDYRLKIIDAVSNTSDSALSLPRHSVRTGPMHAPTAGSARGVFVYLGVDALPATVGEGVQHYGGKIPEFFRAEQQKRGLAAPPLSVKHKVRQPAEWLAVKNKFFAQILLPQGGGAGYAISARQLQPAGAAPPAANAPTPAVLGCGGRSGGPVESVCAAMELDALRLGPGESMTREFRYYLGPKKHSILKTLGMYQDEIMEFGTWSFFCKILLAALNAIYSVIPNYGLAIIVLTVLVRVLLWPITHKSTESMKRMQEIQPLVKELQEKYKGNPKKLQEETFALYRKHKVNPMSGCLPLLVQLPVFIALYRVLASAIELRFAGFLWIKDLSEPENIMLFAGQPFALNILPIFMTATMIWQQKLTPAGDPNQQKMLTVLMPLMMLVFFYSMPSALVLYWTTNQCIMIGQQLLAKYRSRKATASVSP